MGAQNLRGHGLGLDTKRWTLEAIKSGNAKAAVMGKSGI